MDYFSELKQDPIWVNYVRIWDEKKGGYRKPPVNPHNLYNASPTNPENWTDYATAYGNIGKNAKIFQNGKLISMQPVEGVGIVLARPLTGIDIDHCINADTGEIMPFAQKIVEDLDSYAELSPSGTGLHIFILDEESEDLGTEFSGINPDGTISETGTAEIDAYNNRRYFTLTGKVYHDRPIRKTSGALRRLLTEYNEKKRKATGTSAPPPTASSPVVSGVTEENTRRMIESALEAIRPADLSVFGEWAAVGSALKQLGFSCDVWETWSSDNGSNPKHVDGYTYKRWSRLRAIDEPERLIIGMAKKYGWNAKDVFSTAERWAYGRSQHTKEELAEYAARKEAEETADRETDEEFMKELNRVIAEDKASQNPQEEAQQEQQEATVPNVPDVNARELSKPESKVTAMIKPIGAYVDGFIMECEHPKPRHSTGFLSLDKRLNGGLFNELYVLNAETSTGKSAIAMTIAQNMTMSGANVLYFALEMSRNEFIARGASAISWELTEDPETAVTAADILYYHFDEKMLPLMEKGRDPFSKVPYGKYAEYVEEYRRRYEKNLFIIERPQIREYMDGEKTKITGENIAKVVKDFYRANPDKPLAVFVDYLQIMEGEDSDRKTKTDKNISDLKDLCTQEKIPVFTISSIGRSGYKQGADLGSSKESGDIEYTTGVALGWDWDGVTNCNVKDETWKTNISSAKEQKRRDREVYHNRLMRMSLLKYRNSERDTQDGLIYYPQYNYFRELDRDKDDRRISDNEVGLDDLLSGKTWL